MILLTRELIIELAKDITNNQLSKSNLTQKKVTVHGKHGDYQSTRLVNIDIESNGKKHSISEETEKKLKENGFSDKQIKELKDKLENVTSLEQVKEIFLETEESNSSNSNEEVTIDSIRQKASELEAKLTKGNLTAKDVNNLCVMVDNYEKDCYKVKGEKNQKLKDSLTLLDDLYGKEGIFTNLLSKYGNNLSEQDKVNVCIILDYYRKLRGRADSRFTNKIDEEILKLYRGSDGVRNIIQKYCRNMLADKLGKSAMISTADIDDTLEINGKNIKQEIVVPYAEVMKGNKPITAGTKEYELAQQYCKNTFELIKSIETEIANETNATRRNALLKARQKAVDTMASVIKSTEQGGALANGEGFEYYTLEVLKRTNTMDNVTISHVGGNISTESDIKVTYQEDGNDNTVYIECKSFPARLGGFNLKCTYENGVLVHVEPSKSGITPSEQAVIDFMNKHLEKANITQEQMKHGINVLGTLSKTITEQETEELKTLIKNSLIEHYSHGDKNAPVIAIDYNGKQYFVPTEKFDEIFISKEGKNGIINALDYNVRFKDSGDNLDTAQQAYIDSVLAEPSANEKLKKFINENSATLDNKKRIEIPDELLPTEYQGLGFKLLKTTDGKSKVTKEGNRTVNELVYGGVNEEVLQSVSIPEKDVIKYIIDKDKSNKKATKKSGKKK